jgi:hypothetical protein
VAEDPSLAPRLGDGPDHLAACHLPMAEGEDLTEFRPTISASERVIEPDGGEGIGVLPASREGSKP